MNKHILFVMRSLDNPELFTQEEKEVNKKSAATDWASADAAWAADAATDWTATDWASANAAWAADAAVYMAYAAYAAYAATDWTATEWWVNKFFERAGEDKQTYIDEVNRLKEVKPMNKHILFVMRSLDNTELFTQEQKEANRKSANTTYAANTAAAAASVYAAVAASVYAAVADTAEGDAEYWINEFFERSGEDKQTYIDEVERLKGE